MTADSQLVVQAALVAALKAFAPLTALLSDGAGSVYDHVPEDAGFPFLSVGESVARPFDDKSAGGMDQQVAIHSWSRQRGLKEVKTIMAAVVEALDRQELSLAGHSLIDISFQFSDSLLDPDGLTRHGIQRFRVVTQAS